MKKLGKIFAFLLTAAMLLSLLAACGPTINVDGGNDPTNNPGSTNTGNPGGNSDNPGGGTTTTETVRDKYASGVTLRMATGYNNPNTGISFDAGTISDNDKKDGKEDGALTLSNGQTYRAGDLKPTWVAVSERLGINFEDKWTGAGSASKEYDYWSERLGDVDMVAGSASTLAEAGAAGKLVNIAEYLDLMPNFKKYLDENPIVKLSIVGDVETGAIYYSPYFDGVNDIERMPLMRTDWVEKLLNGPGEFTADKYGSVNLFYYKPYMPTEGKVDVQVVKKDGSGVETITKDYSAYGNIVNLMNMADSINGVEIVNQLRDYIDKTYNGYYGDDRADLFIGQNAAWDADELVALLRCVIANPQTLNGTDKVYGLFSREDNNMQRKVDMFRFAGTLFGVRGLESRKDYLYVGNDGQLHDARQEADAYEAMERLNAMAREGLISESFLKDQEESTKTMLQNDLGFMHYDYSQTQTLYNDPSQNIMDAGEMYRPVMIPVARWNDGTGEQFFRFTESWRSVKTDGWALTKAGAGSSDDKLYAALAIIDYAYSTEGQILMSYGPDEFIKTNADGSYVYFDFNGEKWPEIADSTREELWSLASGNYTNYARFYLGSTLSFLKSQAFEYQCTADAGRLGAGYISTAIGLGTIKHPELSVNGSNGNQWYTIVPTTLPTDKQQNDQIAQFTELSSSGEFNQSKGGSNLFIDIIINGYNNKAPATKAEDVAAYVANNWNGSSYLRIQNVAWGDAVTYYNSSN